MILIENIYEAQNILDRNEVFVVLYRPNKKFHKGLDEKLKCIYLKYTDHDKNNYTFGYLNDSDNGCFSRKDDPKYYKLTDDEKIKHVVWRVI